jgi:hypothetical protein
MRAMRAFKHLEPWLPHGSDLPSDCKSTRPYHAIPELPESRGISKCLNCQMISEILLKHAHAFASGCFFQRGRSKTGYCTIHPIYSRLRDWWHYLVWHLHLWALFLHLLSSHRRRSQSERSQVKETPYYRPFRLLSTPGVNVPDAKHSWICKYCIHNIIIM